MKRSLLLLGGLVAAAGAQAQTPPAGSAYDTDPQSTYVEDATSQGVGTVNMITCFIKSMAPADMVNKGPYKALVDENKCDSKRRSDTSNSSGGASAAAPEYTQATVDSTRSSNSDPMKAKVWVHTTMGPNDTPGLIYVGLSATQAPSASAPYGVFRMDFCGQPLNALQPQCLMRGVLNASASGLTFFQAEPNSGNGGGTTRLALTRDSGGDTGAGALSFAADGGATAAFSFAYNPTLYRRGDGVTPDVCFSRSLADADQSVWRYGVYNADGTRVERNSGFPVTWTDASTGKTYQGNVGYYGLWMQDNKTDAVPNGATLTRQNFGSNAPTQSYLLFRAGGRLTKYVKRTVTLDQLVNMRLMANFNVPGANPSFQSIEMFFNGTQFVKSGDQQCGSNGCRIVPLAQPQPIDNAFWGTVMGGVFGYSQQLNGEVRIADLSGLATPTSVQVAYREQSLVYPSEMPTSLYCLGECASLASMTAFFTGQANPPTPWIPGTGSRQFDPNGFPASDLIAYTMTDGALVKNGESAPMLWNAAWSASGNYQWGFRNGKMFTDPTQVACSQGSPNVCGSKVNDLDVYYTWETGPNSFNQFVALTTTDGSNCGASADRFCRFDAPLQLTYTVPNDAAYGDYAGQKVVLQYGGWGNLWGIPGVCVNRLTNAVVDCANSNRDTRYVPAFVIPFDPVNGVVKAGNTSYFVKWLDREVRFKQVALAQCQGAGLTLPTGLTLPDGSDFKAVGVASSADYIGNEPQVDGAPRVIDGEVKY